MAEPPLWIYSVLSFLGAIGYFIAVWLLTRFGAKSADQPIHPSAPHVVSICYDPGVNQTTVQYSNGRQLFLVGPPGSFTRLWDGEHWQPISQPAEPGQPVTPDVLRQLLGKPGDGAAAARVTFDQEGGFTEN